MASSEILDDLDYRPTFGIRLRFLKPPAGHKADLVIEYNLSPGVSGPLPHFHPRLTETFEVIEGELDLMTDGRWQTLKPGQVLDVTPGHRHTFRNRSHQPTIILTYIEPHGGFLAFFTDLYLLVKAGNFRNHYNPVFVAWYAQLEHKHRKDFLSVQPFRLLLRTYGALAHALGIRMPDPPRPIVKLWPMSAREGAHVPAEREREG
ncbi:MAG: cupin domain-containing protein [Bacteroidia bacterium]|nr:cupin domain-containing protein [Bacteroidia bacterium]